MNKDNIWIVVSSRQGVRLPVKRQISKVVEEVSVEETPLGDKLYYHLYELNSPEWPFDVNIRDDMSYGKIVKHQNHDGSGLWLNTLFYTFNEEDAKRYYENEFKRFEHSIRKHRYFKVLSGKHADTIFIEADFDGCMHYAKIPGEPYTVRLWANECVEVMDYDGKLFPKPITGYHEHPNLSCPECHEEIEPMDWMTDASRIYKMDCPHCGIAFDVALSVEVSYSASTDIDTFLSDKLKD